jgi:hypothetical protein
MAHIEARKARMAQGAYRDSNPRLDGGPRAEAVAHLLLFVIPASVSSYSELRPLPPENAARNFAKVVQRVPVKIHGPGARRAAARGCGAPRRELAEGSERRQERDLRRISVRAARGRLSLLTSGAEAAAACSGGVGDRGHVLNHFATLGTAVGMSYLRRTSGREIG